MVARFRLALIAWGMISLLWGYVLLVELPAVPYALAIIVLAVFFADLGSYVFHYIVDHYGRPNPGGVVYEFQRHHLIPDGIVQKPVSEVLFPAVRVVTPVLMLLLPALYSGLISPLMGLLLFVLACCWVLAQLFHRWSHMQTQGLVRMAQNLGLLVSPAVHRDHHRSPFDKRFAVITGWSNYPLDALQAPRLIDAVMAALGFQKRGLVRSLNEIQETS